jgi:hypothetical protein
MVNNVYFKHSFQNVSDIKSEIFIGIDEYSSDGFDIYDYLVTSGDFEYGKISLLIKKFTSDASFIFA